MNLARLERRTNSAEESARGPDTVPFILFVLFVLLSAHFLGASAEESPQAIWSVNGRQWTVEDEKEFAKWVETNVTEDFLIRYRIPVDCADVPYSIRWIYARTEHLPAAATADDGRLIGHWSTEWGHLPTHLEWHEDLRFRAALLSMLSRTSTRTLPLDTYPIRITPDSVSAGTVFLTESHSGIIGRVSLDGSYAHPLQTWEATVPVKLRKLNHNSFFLQEPDSTTHSGLVKFRWPILDNGRWRYLPVEAYPFYSEEQYSPAFYDGYIDYTEAVSKRLDPTEYDPWQRVDKIIGTITHYLQDRIPIVLEGYERCNKGGCREGSELWEVHSTPNRDAIIALMMGHLNEWIESKHLDEEAVRKKMESISLEISQDHSVTFYHIYQNCLWLSHQPGDSIEARWGLKKCDMILSRIGDASESIRFIEMTYREKDPEFAEIQTQRQREIIGSLREEGARSQCEDAEAQNHVAIK